MPFRKHLVTFPDPFKSLPYRHQDNVTSSSNIFSDIRQRLPNLKYLYSFCPGSYTHSHDPLRCPRLSFNLESSAYECKNPTVKGSSMILVDVSHLEYACLGNGEKSLATLSWEVFEQEKKSFPDWKVQGIKLVAMANKYVFISYSCLNYYDSSK